MDIGVEFSFSPQVSLNTRYLAVDKLAIDSVKLVIVHFGPDFTTTTFACVCVYNVRRIVLMINACAVYNVCMHLSLIQNSA